MSAFITMATSRRSAAGSRARQCLVERARLLVGVTAGDKRPRRARAMSAVSSAQLSATTSTRSGGCDCANNESSAAPIRSASLCAGSSTVRRRVFSTSPVAVGSSVSGTCGSRSSCSRLTPTGLRTRLRIRRASSGRGAGIRRSWPARHRRCGSQRREPDEEKRRPRAARPTPATRPARQSRPPSGIRPTSLPESSPKAIQAARASRPNLTPPRMAAIRAEPGHPATRNRHRLARQADTSVCMAASRTSTIAQEMRHGSTPAASDARRRHLAGGVSQSVRSWELRHRDGAGRFSAAVAASVHRLRSRCARERPITYAWVSYATVGLEDRWRQPPTTSG